eukprot:COSAG05_NODE_579_length_8556_cov_44.773679_17_plen_77_part_00
MISTRTRMCEISCVATVCRQRGRRLRRDAQQQRCAAVTIQARQRGKHERREFNEQRDAAVSHARIRYVGKSQSCMV